VKWEKEGIEETRWRRRRRMRRRRRRRIWGRIRT